ncbi:MAG: hypothetical protein IKS48_05860 [Eubacterium sp.]|nr:hypothetical protein [Eubacterium sp.]
MTNYIYNNISFILLVVFECVYVFVDPLIDKDFDVRRVFDHRRVKNIKENAVKHLFAIVMTFFVYVIFCEGAIQLLYDGVDRPVRAVVNEGVVQVLTDGTEKLRPGIGSEVNPIGYVALAFLLAAIYMLNSGMTDKLKYRVMLISVFASAPVLMLIGMIRGWMMNRYMWIFALGYGIIAVMVLRMFLHYWKKEDVR